MRPSAPGSPPRMRVKRPVGFYACCKSGITPAHAGKTEIAGLVRISAEDHPRACG